MHVEDSPWICRADDGSRSLHNLENVNKESEKLIGSFMAVFNIA